MEGRSWTCFSPRGRDSNVVLRLLAKDHWQWIERAEVQAEASLNLSSKVESYLSMVQAIEEEDIKYTWT